MTVRAGPLMLLCLAIACADEGEAPAPEPLVAASTAIVGRGTFVPTIRASGTVVPRAGAVARLAAPAPSRVTAVHVNAGDRVSAGQPLVTLDAPLFAADSAGATAALDAAQAAWERAVRLQREGILAAREVEQRAAELAQARALAATSRRNAELAVLRSPIAGVVTRIDAALGASVDPAMTLVEVVDTRGLELALQLPPAEAARLRSGMRGRLAVPGADTVAILVVAVGAAVDPASRTVPVRARPLTMAGLRVDQTVTALIELPAIADATLLPASALVPEGDSAIVVFTVDSARVVHRTPVTIGPRSDLVVTILAGVTAGQTVVTDGAFAMVDGATLEPADSGRP